ncbi:MAG: hypothetical protein ACHQM6_04990 [Candidatus Kapaibacterium sp.]
MKLFTIKANWFIAFAIAVSLSLGTFTGCANNDNGTNPPGTTQTYNPKAINGVDLSNAITVQNRHTEELMAIDGVIGTGAGLYTDGTPSIYIFTSRDGVAGLPSSLEGIHTTIKNTGIIEAGIPSVDEGIGTRKASNTILNAGFTGTYRAPMYSGVSVGNDRECAAGTISCVVTKNNKNYLLSNNHVFARVNAASIGELIDQQGRYDALPQCGPSGMVASLSQFVAINFSRRSSNVVDCAISEVAPGINWTSGTPPELVPAVQYTPQSTPAAAFVGMNIMKTGRTTGWTSGMISAINVVVSVSYGGGKVARFVNQVYISSTTFSAAGDSGSLIVAVPPAGGSPMPVALLFAGSSNSTIGNPIGSVLAALGVTVVPH